MKHPPVRKAVFPVAGLGTRFLPATKAMPKEMLPLVDKPLVQNAIDEAREAGIEEFVFVTSRGKGVLEDHFDISPELNATLEARSKAKELALVKDTEISSGHLYFTRQHKPLGLGHAVWCAKQVIGREPFAILLPDDVVLSERGCAMTPLSIVAWFARAYRAVGLEGCSSHSGRRTFITRAARLVHEAGGSLRDVQLLAGHRSIQTTQRYIDGDTDAQRKLVSLI